MALASNLGGLLRIASSAFDPPERLTVSEAAKKYVYLKNLPKYQGPWKPNETPYMVEPQNMAMSPDHTGLVFCGSSQTGKTQGLLLNLLAFIIKCFPIDVLLFGPSQPAARDFSKRRVGRMQKDSKELGAEVLPGRDNDNTHDKMYKSGMMLSLTWPSINEMSSKPVPMVMITEYDRIPDNVDGEGSAWFLASARTTSFLNMAMTVAESSPARVVEDAKWKQPPGTHLAPPCKGILGLYNEGTRHRWYWPCPHCGEFFEGSFDNLVYQTTKKVDGEDVPIDDREIAKSVFMACPKNGCLIEPHHKYGMNLRGVWLAEGETITADGVRGGTPRQSTRLSYWLKGTAAAYTTWPQLVLAYVAAMRTYERTGSEEELKTVLNTKLAEPYRPMVTEMQRLAEDIMNLALPLGYKVVPDNVRALFACCDIQKHRWEVQVMGIRPSVNGKFDIVVIDRFPIIKSKRESDVSEGYHWVSPHAEPEDWDLIIEQVMDRTYPLADGSGQMKIAMTFCDSGGAEGATANAYNFYRKLKRMSRSNRFMLVKGEPKPGAPRAAVDFPDTKKADSKAQAHGEIPVLFFNSNALKDTLNGLLDRKDGTGVVFPDWLELSFYEELTVEVRHGLKWENKAGRRNETWDLLYYMLGACAWRGLDNVDWDAPPKWLAPWAENPLVELTALPQNGQVDKSRSVSHRMADLASQLA